MSRMKGSRYLVISYFRAPRLPLRSAATGERTRETDREREEGRERGPRPITGPVRVTADRERGGGRGGGEREGQSDASPFLSGFYLRPPLTHLLTPDFLFFLSSLPLCHALLFVPHPPPFPPPSSLLLLPFKHSEG